MGFNAAPGYPGTKDRRHGAARPVERKLGPSRATVGARLKMTLTSHLGPAGAGVQQQHRQNRKTRSHVRQLQALGYAVTLTPAA
jgi:hypothetical protein